PGRALRACRRRAQSRGRAPGSEEMKFPMPKGACDTHMHFYDGAATAKPGTPNPGHFTVPMYRELQRQLGLERVIVVQPNAYAYDNSVTLAAMRELGASAKG